MLHQRLEASLRRTDLCPAHTRESIPSLSFQDVVLLPELSPQIASDEGLINVIHRSGIG